MARVVMKKALKRMGTFSDGKSCLNVLIETPKGSRVKFAFDQDTGLFELKRALPEGMVFPFNFGFVVGTKAADGDPLDILVMNEETLFPGCLVKVRPIGVIKAEQTEDGHTERNDRLIGLAIPKESPRSLEQMDMDKKTLEEIELFFVSYNRLDGKKFKVLGRSGPKRALSIVRKCQKNERKG